MSVLHQSTSALRVASKNLRTWTTALLLCAWLLPTGMVVGEEAAAKKEEPTPAKAEEPKKFPEWDKVVKDAKKLEGLLNLYFNEKEQELFMEIRKDQYDKDFICPISIARGTGGWFLGGDTLNFGDQWVLNFRRAGDRILVIRRNVYFKANDGSPQSDAVKVSYTDSVIAAVPVKTEQGDRVLIDLSNLFMRDFAGLGIQPDPARSTWGKVKTFEGNVGIEVNAVFPLRMYGFYGLFFQNERGLGEVPDYRGAQVVIHYGLSELPKSNGYKPRLADDRVGHFLTVTKDYSKDLDKTPFVRYVTRWNLEKAEPDAEKSPPKQPIIFWIEKTVPREYRSYVKSGILEWNKAFEQIGFIDAIQVRDQQSADDFDPEDIRYNTFRWITTSTPFAMGPSRTNPLTGEILDADILFDEAMVRYWRQQYLNVAGLPAGLELLAQGERQAWFKMHASDLPALAALEPKLSQIMQSDPTFEKLLRGQREETLHEHHHRGHHATHSTCSIGPGMTRQMGLMAAVMRAQGKLDPGGKVPEEYIGQAIKEVTMHEVGHTLGLRHNFKASNMLSLEDCNKTEVTGKKGMAGSVMDYLPANIALKGEKQGHYFSPTIGPYDYWAIEYAYKPVKGDESEELKKIASRVAEPDLIYGTDEDLWRNPDPRINAYDLGDPLDYAQQRIKMVEENLKELAERMVAEGEGWQRARDAFGLLLGELSSSAYLAAQYVGGEFTNRDHRGDPNARTPYEPIPVDKQRQAMAFVSEHILSDKAFKFSPELLKRLAPEHWSHWGMYGFGGDPPAVYDQVLWIQRGVLSRMLDARVLNRIQNIELHSDGEVLKMPEVFDVVTRAVWTELPAVDESADADKKVAISTIRRNLQREHLKRLSQMVLGPRQSNMFFSDMFYYSFYAPDPPADARSLARHHLRQLDSRINKLLESKDRIGDDYTVAHLEQLHHQIDKVLNADLQSNDP